MRLKDNSINVHGVSNELLYGRMILMYVAIKFKMDLRTTSVCDYEHSRRSEHYKGDAEDFGSKEFSTELKHRFLDEVNKRLNSEYRIMLEKEGTQYEHFHFEYNPIFQSN